MSAQLDVLIVAPDEDVHARAVERELVSLGAVVLVLDAKDYPSRVVLRYSNQSIGGEQHLTLVGADGRPYIVTRRTSVWWRRPRRHDVGSIAHPKVAASAQLESRAAFLGSLSSVCSLFVNKPSASDEARLKLLQLVRAQQVGLKTPRTFVANDPGFIRQQASTESLIYKMFSGADYGFFETRKLSSDDLPDLWRLKHCPSIFQSYIPGELDLRVTVVGGDAFCAAIDFQHGPHKIDGRVDANPVFAFELDAETEQKVLRLVQSFGLSYAAIDLRYSSSEGITFFELNPEGQYLWTEIRANLPISHAMANLLLLSEAASLVACA